MVDETRRGFKIQMFRWIALKSDPLHHCNLSPPSFAPMSVEEDRNKSLCAGSMRLVDQILCNIKSDTRNIITSSVRFAIHHHSQSDNQKNEGVGCAFVVPEGTAKRMR